MVVSNNVRGSCKGAVLPPHGSRGTCAGCGRGDEECSHITRWPYYREGGREQPHRYFHLCGVAAAQSKHNGPYNYTDTSVD